MMSKVSFPNQDMITIHKERYTENFLQVGKLLPLRQYSGYLSGQNEPITQMTYKRTWERIRKTIDLHGATAHILRHTYITMAVSHVDIKTLQSIAGHADICTAMNRYAHGRVDKVIEAGRALEGMLGR